ncbi:Crp/Fnr family transcriptional regulator [Chakrabartyella piscis]|uniref:Crp/Fnr family transcriptional regulator n=1 Tax=Chakrabartyella piscis TaxID=2918914 RepID=UPI00295864E1|nr:Crp/Fnr family transcriptional regulator [Chakrabartyella piscis]
MKKYFEIMKNNLLFGDITSEELESMLGCLEAKEQNYVKREVILFTGNPIDFVGMVLSGSVKIIKEDLDGNDMLLAEIGVGELFGEVFACAEISHSPVTIVAMDHTKVMFFKYQKIITTCQRSCVFHAKLTENMLKILAQKNLLLNQKIDILSKRSLREKILCYFMYQCKGEKKFSIPLNREELASYLCADRSALSAELSKMQKEGLIQYQKNQFELL